MRDPLYQIPVRYKLPLLFVVVCLLAFGVGGYLVSGSARIALEQEILTRLEFQSRAYAMALEGRLQTLAKRTEDFASDGYIRDHAEALLTSREDEARERGRKELRLHLVENKLPLEPSFLELCVVAADGRVLLSTGGESAQTVAERYSQGADNSPTDCSDFLAAGESDSPRLYISTPIHSRRGGRYLGRLASWIRPEVWIASSLRSSGHALDTGGDQVHLQLVDGLRHHLFVEATTIDSRLDPLALDADGSGFRLVLLGAEAAAARVRQLTRGSGRDSLAKAFPIGSTGWSLQVDHVPENALAPVGGLQNRFLTVGLALALAASALLFFPMRFLARPLVRLTEAARRLGEGDYSIRVGVESVDEIGQLADSFNAMASAVQERSESLERSAEDLRDRQRELAAERDRMRAVISSMRDGLVVLDADGDVLVHNRAAAPIVDVLGNSVRELRSHHVCEVGESGRGDCRGCLLDPAGSPRSCVLEVAGGVFEIHATRLTPDPSGRSGRVLVSRDLSDRIQQDERQIHQERLAVLGEVAAVMAHELNNPLAAISMYNQLNAADAEGGSEAEANAAVIARNVQTCKRTIRDLLDYATDTTPEIAPIDLVETLEDVASFTRPLRERADVELLVEAPEPCEVIGDEVQLRQVFVNLVVNAIQALEERGGRIVVSVTVEGHHAVVDVADDGPGIPPEAHDQVFRPFFTTKARGTGTGLGLSTSRRIAEMHGGGLELLRTGSEGTCFRVRLSLAPEVVA